MTALSLFYLNEQTWMDASDRSVRCHERTKAPSELVVDQADAAKHYADARRIRVRERKSIFQTVVAPADGTVAAAVGNGDFGTSPFFGQLLDEPQLGTAGCPRNLMRPSAPLRTSTVSHGQYALNCVSKPE